MNHNSLSELRSRMCTSFVLNMCGIELTETSFQKKKGHQQEDPNIACSTAACKQNKGEHNRVDFPANKQQQQQQQQLEEQQKQEQQKKGQLRPADLSSKQKLEQRGESNEERTRKLALPGVQLTLLSLRGSLTSFSEQGGVKHAGRWVMIPKLAGTTPSSTLQHHKQKAWKETSKEAATDLHQLVNNSCNQWHNNNSLGIGEQETAGSLEQQTLACRPPRQTWKILVDTGAELSVAPRSFAAEIQLSPLEEDLELRTANGMAIQTFGIRTVQLLSQGL